MKIEEFFVERDCGGLFKPNVPIQLFQKQLMKSLLVQKKFKFEEKVAKTTI